MDDDSLPHMLVPYHFYGLMMPLVIKTAQPAAALAAAIKQIAYEVGMRRPMHDIRPMQDDVDRAMVRWPTSTAQRTQEFGVRMALGASAPQILGSVAREGVMLSALGAAAGLAGAAVVSTWLRDLLDEVGPFDGATLIGVTGLVAIVAVVSAISTAWRAARVDPVAALRAE